MTGSIRQAKSDEDAAILSDLGRRTFAETFGHMYAPADLEMFLTDKHSAAVNKRLIEAEDTMAWIACDEEGNPVGFTTVGACDLPVPDRPESAGELQRFYLLTDHQGKGLGGCMLKTALAWLETRYKHLYLSVYSENHGAQRLYARHGFEKIHEYFYMVGNQADPEYIMYRARQ